MNRARSVCMRRLGGSSLFAAAMATAIGGLGGAVVADPPQSKHYKVYDLLAATPIGAWRVIGGHGDRIGTVCTAMDWTGIGRYDVMVGSRRAAPSTTGYVKVFSGDDGSLLYTFKPAVGETEDSSFPHAYLGDEDDNGVPDVVAIGVSTWGGGDGVVFIYDHLLLPPTFAEFDDDAIYTIVGQDGLDEGTGYNLDVGQFNTDTSLDLAIGAARKNNPNGDITNAGACYIIHDLLDLGPDNVLLVDGDVVQYGDHCQTKLSVDLIVIPDNEGGTGDEIALGQSSYWVTQDTCTGDKEDILGRVKIWNDGTPTNIDHLDLCGCADLDVGGTCESAPNFVCFGHRIDRAGDVDNDDDMDLIISDGQNNQAHVFIFDDVGGDYDLKWTLRADNTDRFGREVIGIGDVDGDGHYDVAVADEKWDSLTQNDLGRVFVYSSRTLTDTGSNVQEPLFTITGELADARLGERMGNVEDLNHDGFPDLAVAAVDYNDHLHAGPPDLAHGAVYGVFTPTMPIDSVTTDKGTDYGTNVQSDIEASDDVDYAVDSDENGLARLEVKFDVSLYSEDLDIGFIALSFEVDTVGASDHTDVDVQMLQDGGGWTVIDSTTTVLNGGADVLLIYAGDGAGGAVDNGDTEHIPELTEVVTVLVGVQSNGADVDFRAFFDKVTLMVSPNY